MVSSKSFGFALIDKNQNVLIVREKASKMYGLPKGRKDSINESDDDTMKRELLEETRINIDHVKHTVLGITKHKYIIIKTIVVEIRINPSIEFTDEIIEAKWVSLTELFKNRNKSSRYGRKYNWSIIALYKQRNTIKKHFQCKYDDNIMKNIQFLRLFTNELN